MTQSFATVTPSNFELSPARISLNGVDLGATNGTVKVTITTKKADLKADQFGESVIDRKESGMEIKVETILAEISDLAKWKAAMPNINKVGSGPYGGYLESKIGLSDLSLALPLLIHPLSRGNADKGGDYLFYKATADSVTEVVFGPTEQQGLKVVWNVYPDTTVTPARWMFFGDTSIGLVAASAGAPSFAGTGNGTLTSVTPHSGFTKTETITIKCVGIPSPNQSNWAALGSISGVTDYFTVGAGGTGALVTPQLDAVVTDGGVDFIIGDNWTVATTAANYV